MSNSQNEGHFGLIFCKNSQNEGHFGLDKALEMKENGALQNGEELLQLELFNFAAEGEVRWDELDGAKLDLIFVIFSNAIAMAI